MALSLATTMFGRITVAVMITFIATLVLIVFMGENEITSVRRIHMTEYGKSFAISNLLLLVNGTIPDGLFFVVGRCCSLIGRRKGDRVAYILHGPEDARTPT